MENVADNDERTVAQGPDEWWDLGEWNPDVEDAAVNRREFFTESEEVLRMLGRVVVPDLSMQDCRADCDRIRGVWLQYQEQPGLLDPFMEQMVGILIGAVRAAVWSPSPLEALPNLHLVSSTLYVLMMVRGYKKVSRVFPHEAADLECCLEALEAPRSHSTWTTPYCLTLWLAMMLLTPFDLGTIDSGGAKPLAVRILELGLDGLRDTGRIRDASAWMLGKLFTRPDVAFTGAVESFFQWTEEAWSAQPPQAGGTLIVQLGALQAWNQTFKVASRESLKPLWTKLMDLVLKGPAGQGEKDFASSSKLRKFRLAIACRAALVALPPRLASWRYDRGARSLMDNFASATGRASAHAETTPTGDEEDEDDEDVPEQIEEVIELLLASLSDSDTVVRWSGAKALGRITNRLSREFGDQVLQSLMDRCFSFRETDKVWHGGCLALAELTRRGLLLPERLPAIVPLVCQALHYEVTSGNLVTGQHVRDAACYVCWAFARAFAPCVLVPYVSEMSAALIQVAVYDREINCRRAAAAAVQEHVGRQGTFPNGIDVVTSADFWTLSNRRHSYLVVAPQLAHFATYRRVLIDHLVDRKIAHLDLEVRRLASQGLAKLLEDPGVEIVAHVNEVVLPKLLARAAEIDTTSVASRHGALIALTAVIDPLQSHVAAEVQDKIRSLVVDLEKARAYRGRGGESIRQAVCEMLGRVAGAASWPFKAKTGIRYLKTIDECLVHAGAVQVQVAAADALHILAHSRLQEEPLQLCVEKYLVGLNTSDATISGRRGHILSLSSLPRCAFGSRYGEVIAILCREVQGAKASSHQDAVTRQYATIALGRLCSVNGVEDTNLLTTTLTAAMHDYATDRRGDIGSWVREAAMEVIVVVLDMQRRQDPTFTLDPGVATNLLALVLRQALERIDKVREHAHDLLEFLIFDSVSVPLMKYAYRRACHGEPYTLRGTARSPGIRDGCWLPPHCDELASALEVVITHRLERTPELLTKMFGAQAVKEDVPFHTVIVGALIPLLDFDEFLPTVVPGLVASMGQFRHSSDNWVRAAVARYLESRSSTQARRFCDEIVSGLERCLTGGSDAARFLEPFLNCTAFLLDSGCCPQELAPSLFEKVEKVVRRDLSNLTLISAAIPVLVGLLQWPRIRRPILTLLLGLLGHGFPRLRVAAAQALYLRFLEDGDFDIGDEPGASAIPADVVMTVSELLLNTAWVESGGHLETALQELHELLRIDPPEAGAFLMPVQMVKMSDIHAEGYHTMCARER